MHSYLSVIRPGLFALAAWLLVAIPSISVQEWLPPNRYEFGVPRVCVPYTPGTDVVSLVPDLFSALAIACLCLVLTEVAKVSVIGLPGHLPLYGTFLIFQATLVVDVLRKYAWDWYGYLLYYLRLTNLSYDQPRPEILPIPSPWLSMFVLLGCASLYTISLRAKTRSGE